MSEMTGVVQEVKPKSVSGGRTAYDIVVGGQAYGYGMFAPKCKTGDYVKFEVDESRGYKNVARNTLKVSANKAPPEALAAAAATAPRPNSSGGSVDHRQDTISRQAASNTAIQFLAVLASADALGLPTGAKGNKQAALEDMLHKYEQEFYENNTGVKWESIAPGKSETIVPEVSVAQDRAEVSPPDEDEWK